MFASFGPASLVVRPRAALLALGVTLTTLVGCVASTDELEPFDQLTQGIQTFPNQEPAFDFFVGKGLTPAQSAGVVGNLSAESGVDPTIKQLGGGPGRGIAQWQVGGRWDTTANDNVLDYAAEQGQSSLSLGLQLDFIWYELTSFPSYGLTSLKSASSASAAATTFAAKFEGCPACDMDKRIEYANDILARFGSGNGGSSSSSSSGGVPCTVDETGESGDCVSTAECAERGNSISTPGYCPGSSDVQCCTALESASSSGGGGSSGASSGGKKAGVDGGVDDDEPNAEEEEFQRSEPEFGEGGCSTSGTTGGSWLIGTALLLTGLRRRRA